jgi:phenylalanyl-tRNA synthetase alpha chain
MSMLDDIATLDTDARAALAAAGDAAALEAWRVRYLGRNGALAGLMTRLGSLAPEERRDAGSRANQAKQALEAAFDAALQRAASAADDAEAVDVTLPGRTPPIGRLHPITQVTREICAVFTSMGFQVAEGPEVEWDYYNFEALCLPRDHPARDAHDTFWVTDPDDERPMLMRTHTSPMQIRIMEQMGPPLRVIVPGRVYRYEATDATHESQFSQVEGFAVGEHITFAELKGTLLEFARRMFGRERQVRFRNDYFPYVEPGVDMAIDAPHHPDGWIEILGAGMIHPEVLRRVGIDPDKYSGFAFGLGPERVAILRHGIEDIRHFYANDLRFLRQFP